MYLSNLKSLVFCGLSATLVSACNVDKPENYFGSQVGTVSFPLTSGNSPNDASSNDVSQQSQEDPTPDEAVPAEEVTFDLVTPVEEIFSVEVVEDGVETRNIPKDRFSLEGSLLRIQVKTFEEIRSKSEGNSEVVVTFRKSSPE